MPRLKPFTLNLLLQVALVLANLALWRLMFGFLPDLSKLATIAIGLAAVSVFYTVYFWRRPCGHGRITGGGRHEWWPHVVKLCAECGDEI